MRNIASLLCLPVCVSAAGCQQGTSVGTVIELKRQTLLILDKDDYEEYAELKRAGADTKGFTGFVGDSFQLKHKWTLLFEQSKVRVLGHVPSGIKVFVDRGMDHDIVSSLKEKKRVLTQVPWKTGTTGYIHFDDLGR